MICTLLGIEIRAMKRNVPARQGNRARPNCFRRALASASEAGALATLVRAQFAHDFFTGGSNVDAKIL